MVKEDFLHYLWKLRKFNTDALTGAKGESIDLVCLGVHNHNAGPDFMNATLRIDGQLWAGNVEMHIKSSDWFVHGHETDTNYDNVILHVVWEHDMNIYSSNDRIIPTLVLSKFVQKEIAQNYVNLVQHKRRWMNCEHRINEVDKHLIHLCIERMYIERLAQKTNRISTRLNVLNNDWEAVLFETLARNFGLKVNADAFESVAQQLGFTNVRKVRSNQFSLEALLYGQAGMLEDEHPLFYYQNLKKEYSYLGNKLKLESGGLIPFQFFRLRPHNFPTVRIAQLAALYFKEEHLFSKLMEISDLKAYYALLDIEVSPFWKKHFSFNATSPPSSKKLSPSFIELLLMNTVIPFKYLYLNFLGRYDPAILFKTMEQLKPERNSILAKFTELGIPHTNALESQGLIQLRNEYCKPNACLKCPIGSKLITLKKGGYG